MLRFVFVTLTILGLSCPRTGTTEPRIGVIAGFSGDSAAYGAAYRNGIELTGLGGKVTFIYEDDQFIPSKTITAFQKLVDVDKVSAVIVGDTVTSQAVASIARNKKISLLGWASADRAFLNNPYALRLWTTNDKDYGYVAEEVARRGYKKIALFTSTHTYASGWGEALHKRFPESSWEDFSKAPESFQSYILRVKREGYDAVGLCLSPGLNGLFTKQMRSLRVSLPRFACDFVEATADIQAAMGTLDGLWFTAPRVSPAFIDRYRDAFKMTDHLVSAALFHDAALIATGTTDNPFAVEELKVVVEGGDRHLQFPFATFVFKGAEILPSPLETPSSEGVPQ